MIVEGNISLLVAHGLYPENGSLGYVAHLAQRVMCCE